MATLTNRGLRALRWNYIGVTTRAVAQLVAQLTLARMLGPDVFGIFALVLLSIGVGNILAEMGMGAALIHKQELTENDARRAFTRLFLASALVTVALFAVATPLADYLGDERISAVLRCTAPAIVIQALGVTSLSLLRRDLAYKEIQIVQTASYAFGFMIVGVASAALGAGVWSLVFASLSQTTSATTCYYFLRRHSIKPEFSSDRGKLNKFARRALLTNIVNWVVENLDNLLVGKLFGSAALGLYSVSYNFVRAPANHLVIGVQSVLFPLSSRSQDNVAGLRVAYLVAVSGVALAVFPVFVGIAAASGTISDALLGSGWGGVSALLTPLALSMPLYAMAALAGSLLWGRGAVGLELKIQAATAAILVAAIFLVGRNTVNDLAWAVFGVYSLRFVGMSAAVLNELRLPVVELLRALRGGGLGGVFVCACLLILDPLLSGIGPGLRLLAEISTAGLGVVLMIGIFPRLMLSADLLCLLERTFPKNPRLKRLLQRTGGQTRRTSESLESR